MRHGLGHIVFELDPPSPDGAVNEVLWAEPVGGDRYRLRNVPFSAFGVSVEDIVHAEERDDGRLYFTKVSIRAGHSTFRLALAVAHPSVEFDEYWAPLRALGCGYEGGEIGIAVDVPPAADIDAIYPLLDAGEAAGIWQVDEGHIGHLTRSRQDQ